MVIRFQQFLQNFFEKYPYAVLVLVILLSVFASFQSILQPPKTYDGVLYYTNYNNYLIFKSSFFHLIESKDLYVHHEKDHFDLYKYSPTFAVFFGLFAYLPDWLGLNLWNLVNSVSLYFAVLMLPKLGTNSKYFLILFVLVELMTSLQNEQANGLMAALMIFTFEFLERKNPFWAAFCLFFSVFIKIFGIVFLIFWLFYPDKKLFFKYLVLWFGIFFLAPLLFTSWEYYVFLLKSYLKMLSEDHSVSYGLSVLGWFQTWFSISAKNELLVIGAVLLLIPLYQISHYPLHEYRLLYLASLLIWVIIFNHKAESPTFIISMVGIGIWYAYFRSSPLDDYLMIFALIFTSLSSTDLFPSFVRKEYFVPYVVKAIPSILIWLRILWLQNAKSFISKAI